ncbi:hypothetical protein C1E23_11665 [Pseudoalteromonas phenolica]|uniref:Uncharacterized protein n=1 Tax=Pseudoalteromonas phenolica TaxID=161398 RepID=A0A4Q7INF0_9GAMM|nr:hypothetical protein [Pseudoalteromonas phenolica]RZQ52916.1 hypothetical protein C1E23_11665 [Pseudoalteromonas phenolica]
MSFNFISVVETAFKFLESKGFKKHVSLPARGESSASYSSDRVMILINYVSYSDECWCVVGGSREHYPAKSLSINELIDFHGLDIQLSKKPDVFLSQLAAILQSEFVTLTQNSLVLLEPLWAEKDSLENALCEYQNKIAFSVVEIGKAKILELPNTKEALGHDYIDQFPHHDFSQDKVWLVITDMFSSVCDSFEQAQDFAKSFGD